MSNDLTNFIFPSNNHRKSTPTTLKPIPSIKTFSQEWSVSTQPMITQNGNGNFLPAPNQGIQIAQQTTSVMPTWMQEILNEQSTTPISSNHLLFQTTQKPFKTTTINSFLSEWPAPTISTNIVDTDKETSSINQVQISSERKTTTEMPNWMQQILNEQSTISNNRAVQTTIETEIDMPSWMRDVLDEHSTKTTTTVRPTIMSLPFVVSTTKSPINGDGGGNQFIGDGEGGGVLNRYSI